MVFQNTYYLPLQGVPESTMCYRMIDVSKEKKYNIKIQYKNTRKNIIWKWLNIEVLKCSRKLY